MNIKFMNENNNQSLLNSKNPHELRKTIRFNLEPNNITRPFQLIKNSEKDLHEQITNFINNYNTVIENTDKLVFYFSEKDKVKSLKKKIYIKHSWLRNYTKIDFYNVKEKIVNYDRNNQVSISDNNLGFLKDYFENWINENKVCTKSLEVFLKQPQENQNRISEFAYWIQKISKRSNFEAIYELFNGCIQHKDSDEEIIKIKNTLIKIKPFLKSLEKELLPSQSLGVEIERASFNYYTVNKKSKNYIEEIEKKEKELNEYFDFNSIRNFDQILFQNIGFIESNLPIGELKEAMKLFKAKHKSRFHDLSNQNKLYYENGETCYKDKFGKKIIYSFFKIYHTKDYRTREIIKTAEENFNDFRDEKNKAKRGKHFQFTLKNYINYCNLYKEVAVKLGKIKAEVKALEKEKIDAERLQSWAVILEKDNQKYILTVPRDAEDNLKKAKEKIEKLQSEESSIWKLYSFESLTLRALDKLCFGLDKNTFYPEIKVELLSKDNAFFEKGNLKRKDQFSDDGLELIKFYQTVLGLKATKNMLKISSFEGLTEIITKEYQDKESFEKHLKQACYYKSIKFISEETKNELVNNFKGKLYKITSYDLIKDDKEEIKKLKCKTQFDRNNPEFHTKIWLDFWTDENNKNNHDIRLNPEFKINFVEKSLDDRTIKKLGDNKTNRKQNDRFLLTSTITLQAHDKNEDLAFKKTDEIITFFNEYNNEFNKKIKPFNLYYYGLDRGQQELLTLGIFKFSENEKVQFTRENNTNSVYNKPEFVNIEAYQIKSDKFREKNSKGRIAYKSISEFLEDPDVLEKVSIISCFDMSCAKLIKDKIVINGDIATYLELKKVSAMRKIYEGVTQSKFKTDNICFKSENSAFFINIENRGKLEDQNLYYYDNRFQSIVSKDSIQNDLQNFLFKLKKKNKLNYTETKSIEIKRINHLRDAICANSVGIINYLQKTYPGMLVFENLNIDNKNKRITEFSGNLGSRVELKLLQKFQSLSLVPPNLKQFLDLQSAKKLKQAGIVLYVDSSGTSSNCPHCETKNSNKTEKWRYHAYKCKNISCNFDTEYPEKRQGLIALDNSDKVATYNIAKRGLKLLNPKKN